VAAAGEWFGDLATSTPLLERRLTRIDGLVVASCPVV
jgi:hypothetical protein